MGLVGHCRIGLFCHQGGTLRVPPGVRSFKSERTFRSADSQIVYLATVFDGPDEQVRLK